MTHTWRWRKTKWGPLDPALSTRFGAPCRVFARGRNLAFTALEAERSKQG